MNCEYRTSNREHRAAGSQLVLAFLAFLAFLAVIAPSARAADLHELTTRHYRIHTDLDSALADDLARRLDAMYDEYTRRLADFRSSGDSPLLDAYLFRQQSDYIAFTGSKLANTGGVFMQRRNILAAFLEGQGRDGLRRTLQHEAFHQFAVAIHPNLPAWLNEGIAQLFEEGIWLGDRFSVGQVPPRRLRQLQDDMQQRRLIPFRTFLNLSNKQWTDNLSADSSLGATQYNQAWAMVHFLVQARNDAGVEKYRARFINLLKLLHAGVDPAAAFTQSFSGNLDGFQDRFVEYIRRLKPTPEAAYIEHLDILADLLREFHTHERSFSDMRSFRQTVIAAGCRLNYTRGPLRWTTDPNPLIYFCDLAGRQLDGDQLLLQPRRDAALPDLILRIDNLQFRTHFHMENSNIDHEMLIESRR